MNGLEEALNGLLSDPEELKKITRLAGELFGGGETGGEGTPEQDSAGQGKPQGRPAGPAGGKNDKGALVKALSPYLSSRRRARLEKAIRLAGMLRLANTAINELGGMDGV